MPPNQILPALAVVCTTVLQLQNRFTVSWKSVVWSAAAVRTWPGLTLHYFRVLGLCLCRCQCQYFKLRLGDVIEEN